MRGQSSDKAGRDFQDDAGALIKCHSEEVALRMPSNTACLAGQLVTMDFSTGLRVPESEGFVARD